ncbi:MAG: transposase [Opitutaceae bacterium]|nr:transposase [Opitutaceae bacterium]
MRHARLKLSSEDSVAAYHVISRTVNGERLLDDDCKKVLQKQIWQVADYCGVRILTYALLSNHFHLLVLVPRREPVSDQELLRRYRVLYPSPTRYQSVRIKVIESQLATNGPLAVAWRKQQLALMGDLSPFVQILKQRFSIWFNHKHNRFGTLWAERFKSDLVEPALHALRTAAAYIDLNSIRAGLVSDPKDYRFCGYAEAVAGVKRAQAGLFCIFGHGTWDHVQSTYRCFLYASGTVEKEGKACIDRKAFEAVIKAGGKLPLASALLCRNRYFSDGAVLGSQAYVRAQLDLYRQKTGRRRKMDIQLLPADITDWGDLAVLRSLRKNAITFPSV